MTLKEQLEKYKDKIVDLYDLKEKSQRDEATGFHYGFSKSVELLLPLVEALEAWNNWENNQIAKEGPYAGKQINELIDNAQNSIAELREKLK